MKRILRSAAVLVAVLGAQHAWGLGLGEAAVSSDMSSPLRMTLPLVGIAGSGVELDAVKVDVPGELEHEALGFPDPIRPQDLRVQLSVNDTGAARIMVTTRSPTREPVLRFLVRAVWPGGQRLRQYELIIDPPAVVRPVRRGGAQPAIVQVRPVPASASAVVLAAPRPATPLRAGTRYGPVAAGDTLHAITRAAYPASVANLEPVMQAVVDRNPGAFVDGDPGRLMMGAFLDLPEPGSLAAAAPVEAPAPATASRSAGVAAGSSSYTVVAGDTLYAIARQVAGPQENLGAVVRTLFENNPQAFVAGDMDRLRAGAVMQVPRAGTTPAFAGAPSQPVVDDTVSQQQIAVLRSDLENTAAEVAGERARQAGMRERLDTLLVQMESLRARDAELTARSEALASELERKNAQVGAAMPAVAAVSVSEAPAIPSPAEPPAVSQAAAEESLNETVAAPSPAESPAASQAAVAEPAIKVVAAPGVVVNPAVQDRPVRTRPARRRISGESGSEPGLLGFLGPLASSPLLWLAAGLFVVAVLVLLVIRKLRSGGRLGASEAAPRPRADEEATALKLAEVRERHSQSGRFEAEALASAKERESSTVHLTDTARAANLAKEAAVHLAYEDYSASKACITEAIRLDPHRDEHKMVLLTVYESTGEQDKARAIVDDLVARREQLPGDLRKQVEQLRQGAGE